MDYKEKYEAALERMKNVVVVPENEAALQTMKAPEKIYVNVEAARDLRYHPGEDDGKEQYIRKDALLEWAKERRKQMKIEAGGCWSMHATGEYMAMDKLIEKLESM